MAHFGLTALSRSRIVPYDRDMAASYSGSTVFFLSATVAASKTPIDPIVPEATNDRSSASGEVKPYEGSSCTLRLAIEGFNWLWINVLNS